MIVETFVRCRQFRPLFVAIAIRYVLRRQHAIVRWTIAVIYLHCLLYAIQMFASTIIASDV